MGVFSFERIYTTLSILSVADTDADYDACNFDCDLDTENEHSKNKSYGQCNKHGNFNSAYPESVACVS